MGRTGVELNTSVMSPDRAGLNTRGPQSTRGQDDWVVVAGVGLNFIYIQKEN
jgi:hypothetical protein